MRCYSRWMTFETPSCVLLINTRPQTHSVDGIEAANRPYLEAKAVGDSLAVDAPARRRVLGAVVGYRRDCRINICPIFSSHGVMLLLAADDDVLITQINEGFMITR